MSKCLPVMTLAMLLCFNANAVLGAVVTYDVDLSATTDNGDLLRAFGTINVDASMPISMSIESYDLQIQRESDPPLTFNDLAFLSASDVDQTMSWELFDGDLYIRRLISPEDDGGVFGWRVDPPNVRATLGFSSGRGGANHFLTYDVDNQRVEAILEPSGGPDPPPGFLVGTAITAIPEPGSAAFLASLGFTAFVFRRRRRIRPARA